MIKNDKGEIKIDGGEIPEIMLEWMQLTHSIALTIKEGAGVEMDIDMMIAYGSKVYREYEEDGKE